MDGKIAGLKAFFIEKKSNFLNWCMRFNVAIAEKHRIFEILTDYSKTIF